MRRVSLCYTPVPDVVVQNPFRIGGAGAGPTNEPLYREVFCLWGDLATITTGVLSSSTEVNCTTPVKTNAVFSPETQGGLTIFLRAVAFDQINFIPTASVQGLPFLLFPHGHLPSILRVSPLILMENQNTMLSLIGNDFVGLRDYVLGRVSCKFTWKDSNTGEESSRRSYVSKLSFSELNCPFPTDIPSNDIVRMEVHFSDKGHEFTVPAKFPTILRVRPVFHIRNALPRWSLESAVTLINIIGANFMDLRVINSTREPVDQLAPNRPEYDPNTDPPPDILDTYTFGLRQKGQYYGHYFCRYGEGLMKQAVRISERRLLCRSPRYKPGTARLEISVPWQGRSWHSMSGFDFLFIEMPRIGSVSPLVVPAETATLPTETNLVIVGQVQSTRLVSVGSVQPKPTPTPNTTHLSHRNV